MNIFKQFLYRHGLIGEFINKSDSNPKNSSLYDESMPVKIAKIRQIDFINGILKEIELVNNWNDTPCLKGNNFSISKFGLIEWVIFDTYVYAFMGEIITNEARKKLIELLDLLIDNYQGEEVKLNDLIELRGKYVNEFVEDEKFNKISI